MSDHPWDYPDTPQGRCARRFELAGFLATVPAIDDAIKACADWLELPAPNTAAGNRCRRRVESSVRHLWATAQHVFAGQPRGVAVMVSGWFADIVGDLTSLHAEKWPDGLTDEEIRHLKNLRDSLLQDARMTPGFEQRHERAEAIRWGKYQHHRRARSWRPPEPEASDDAPQAIGTPSGGQATATRPVGKLTPGSRALAAAKDLTDEGKRVSLKAACERAGVDRANVRKNYPDVVSAIKALSAPDRVPRRGTRDRRTGNVEAIDESDD